MPTEERDTTAPTPAAQPAERRPFVAPSVVDVAAMTELTLLVALNSASWDSY